MRKKKDQETSAPVSGDTRVTPADVQQVEFRLSFRGYKERDVDAFLDRLTEDLTSYIEENERLRAGTAPAGTSGALPVGALAGGAEGARSEAERILAQAREEAARIVREAELRVSVGGSVGADPRTAVAPFLNKEREFLQDLGGLVQGHAEEIKQMVASIRAKTEAAKAGTAHESSEVPAAPSRVVPAAEVPPSAPVGEAPPVAPGADETQTTEEEAFAPITVPDADDATATTSADPEPTPAKLRTDSGDRSLRELFWGED